MEDDGSIPRSLPYFLGIEEWVIKERREVLRKGKMRSRILLGHFLVRLGRFIQSLAIMVMRPNDLLEFNRQKYDKPNSVGRWSSEEVVDRGLSPHEMSLIEKVPSREGRLFLLGVGGGREAISLARMGFDVKDVLSFRESSKGLAPGFLMTAV